MPTKPRHYGGVFLTQAPFCYTNLMKIIVGFGNPEPKYNFTRHNFGFLALDFYAKLENLNFKPEPKFQALIAKQDSVLFVKATTYYNEVGQSISQLINYYKLNPATDLLVICDDFDLPFGTLRYREQGSAAGNNGLKSLIQYLNTQDFARLRLGTNNPELRQNISDADFVLSKFTPKEREQLPQILSETTNFIQKHLK